MSLINCTSWRFMLGIIFAPSIIFCALTVFYLPESPRWLLSKGRMMEAKKALQRLHGKEDVSGSLLRRYLPGFTVGVRVEQRLGFNLVCCENYISLVPDYNG